MPTFAHSLETRTKAITMLRNGASNADVARALKIPAGTVGWWFHEERKRSGTSPGRHVSLCPRCTPDELPLDRKAYSYLLGLYLGDGYICAGPAFEKKGVYILSVSCSNAWPGLMDDCEAAMRAVMPHNSVSRRQRPGMHDVKAYSKHWACLFPQHGPGMKHTRPIILEHWQREVVEEFTEEFIRGLIHSDGCRVYNVATHTTKSGKHTRYYYSRYHFTNESADIRKLFTWALIRLGIDFRYNNYKNISVARRESVRRLDAFVGPKY
jgi:hypothetical protein